MLRIALAQMTPDPNFQGKAGAERTLKKTLKIMQEAVSRGTELLLFPEMWNNGYAILKHEAPDCRRVGGAADEYWQTIREGSAQLGLAVLTTALEEDGEGRLFNRARLFKDGRECLSYAKVHTCHFANERALTPGRSFEVCELNFRQAKLKAGVMICFDREFPESARTLALKGAQLILVPNACELEQNRLSALRADAFTNMCAVAVCNYPQGTAGCRGSSAFFDGIAFDEEGRSRDMLRVQADDKEQLVICDWDDKELLKYREEEFWGAKSRRPEAYTLD